MSRFFISGIGRKLVEICETYFTLAMGIVALHQKSVQTANCAAYTVPIRRANIRSCYRLSVLLHFHRIDIDVGIDVQVHTLVHRISIMKFQPHIHGAKGNIRVHTFNMGFEGSDKRNPRNPGQIYFFLCQTEVHSTGETGSERIHRELQRQVPGRMPQRACIYQPEQRTETNRIVAAGLQLGKTA